MDLVKEAFQKIKEEINFLKQEISLIKSQLNYQNPTNTLKTSAQESYPTDTPAHLNPPTSYGTSSKSTNNRFSTGNEGVPTNTSTYTPTNPQTNNSLIKLPSMKPLDPSPSVEFPFKNEQIDLSKIQGTLESLDAIKREIRLKFKRLTPQEMTVFSTLYTLENQGFEEVTYKLIANHLNLSESSIRDYSNRLLSKGIPLIKHRLNNKTICLKISPELQKIATLSTIIKLREL
jgi:hypothetical protein